MQTELDAIDSCIYEVVVPMQTGGIPRHIPGFGRDRTRIVGADEVVLSVPGSRLDELVDGIFGIFGFNTIRSAKRAGL